MYEIDGIAYAGNQAPLLKVRGIRPLEGFKLWVRFSNEESGIFDCKPLLENPCYAPLKNPDVFRGVYLDYGVPVWNGGEIDIAPEYLYEHSAADEAEDAAFCETLYQEYPADPNKGQTVTIEETAQILGIEAEPQKSPVEAP